MERLDFASITQILRSEASEGRFLSQMEFADALLFECLEAENIHPDMGQLNRTFNGLVKLSPRIINYYQIDKDHLAGLTASLRDTIVPELADPDMAMRKVHDLLICDPSISERKKAELAAGYPCETVEDAAEWLTKLLMFGMERPFQARDVRRPNLLASGAGSPLVRGYVLDEPPQPCAWFCGREADLDALHAALTEHGAVFLSGIPGIGKSELAKAYAAQHRKDYTNILFLPYTGDLRRDLAAIDFADDLPGEPIEVRFERHERFLRSLREDTLLIVDNFNAAQTDDAYLPSLLRFPCRVLITTRSRFEDVCCVTLGEMAPAALFDLTAHFYSDAGRRRKTVEQIIETLHRHTFAVELAARLMENGILSPRKILKKLQKEGASFDASDEIRASKDGAPQSATWYRHIHTLFALSRLNQRRRELMRSLTLTPDTGIPARLFGEWMGLRNLNDVTLLTELGFVQRLPCRMLALHPMLREVTVSELPPGVRECCTLLRSVQLECLKHGLDQSYEPLILQTIENLIRRTVKNDDAVYLRFLEDTFSLAEKHEDRSLMTLILSELTNLLRDETVGTAEDRALLLDSRAWMLERDEERIPLLKEAIALLPEVNAANGHLVSNLHSNLGLLYRRTGNYAMAEAHMETAVNLMVRYGLIGGHDSLMQCLNYAALLFDTGKQQEAIQALEKIRVNLEALPEDMSSDLAQLTEAMGAMYLGIGEIENAREYLRLSLRLYAALWADEPERIEAKVEEMKAYLQQVNLQSITS